MISSHTRPRNLVAAAPVFHPRVLSSPFHFLLPFGPCIFHVSTSFSAPMIYAFMSQSHILPHPCFGPHVVRLFPGTNSVLPVCFHYCVFLPWSCRDRLCEASRELPAVRGLHCRRSQSCSGVCWLTRVVTRCWVFERTVPRPISRAHTNTDATCWLLPLYFCMDRHLSSHMSVGMLAE